jgi:hypothetical protein
MMTALTPIMIPRAVSILRIRFRRMLLKATFNILLNASKACLLVAIS